MVELKCSITILSWSIKPYLLLIPLNMNAGGLWRLDINSVFGITMLIAEELLCLLFTYSLKLNPMSMMKLQRLLLRFVWRYQIEPPSSSEIFLKAFLKKQRDIFCFCISEFFLTHHSPPFFLSMIIETILAVLLDSCLIFKEHRSNVPLLTETGWEWIWMGKKGGDVEELPTKSRERGTHNKDPLCKKRICSQSKGKFI